MYIIIMNALYVFFIVLEVVLFLSILSSWFHVSAKINELFDVLLGPILEPIRYLLKHSIFQVSNYDFATILGLLVMSYLQNFFYTIR